MALPIKNLLFLVFLFSENSYGLPLPIVKSIELARDLQDFINSYLLSSQLREEIFLDEKESDALKKTNVMFRTGRESVISSTLSHALYYEQDMKTSFTLAHSIISKFKISGDYNADLDEIDSTTQLFVKYAKHYLPTAEPVLGDSSVWQIIRLAAKIFECQIDILSSLIKRCAERGNNQQVTSSIQKAGSGIISCSITTVSSANCPPCSFASTNGTLRSPNYPNDYEGPWECEYLLAAATGEKIDLEFQAPFVVEKFYDSITICNGEIPICNNTIMYITGYISPEKLHTKLNKILIKFSTDDSNDALPSGEIAKWQINVSTSVLPSLPTTMAPNTEEPITTTTTKEPTTTTTTEEPTTTTTTEEPTTTTTEEPTTTTTTEEPTTTTTTEEPTTTTTTEEPTTTTTTEEPTTTTTTEEPTTTTRPTGEPTTTTIIEKPTTTTEESTTIISTTKYPHAVSCTAEPGCGSCLSVTSINGTIQSSNYPNDNEDNLNCNIVIEVPLDAKILLTFTTFVVEFNYDFVAVYDEHYTLLREELTGYNVPVPFSVKSNKVTINFQTDENNWSIPDYSYGNTGRWALDFTVIYSTSTTIQDDVTISTLTPLYPSTIRPGSFDYTCTADCGACIDLTQEGGVIQSPDYPADYGNNRNCTVIISTAPLKSRIQLDFTVFNVDQDYDSISICDAERKEYNKISGNTLPDSTILKTTALVLKFNSDSNNLGIFSNLPGRWQANFRVTILQQVTTSTAVTAISSTSTTSTASSSSVATQTTATTPLTTTITTKPTTTSTTSEITTTTPLTTSTTTKPTATFTTETSTSTTTTARSTTKTNTPTTTTVVTENLECPPPLIVSEGQCILLCYDGTIPVNGKCDFCSEPGYILVYEGTCGLYCDTDFVQVFDVCIPYCPAGWTQPDGTCQPNYY